MAIALPLVLARLCYSDCNNKYLCFLISGFWWGLLVFFIEFLSLNYPVLCEMLLLQFAFRKVTVQTLDKACPVQGPVQPVPRERAALNLPASSWALQSVASRTLPQLELKSICALFKIEGVQKRLDGGRETEGGREGTGSFMHSGWESWS